MSAVYGAHVLEFASFTQEIHHKIKFRYINGFTTPNPGVVFIVVMIRVKYD